VAVHLWPQQRDQAVAELRSCSALAVICVATPDSNDRLLARELIRAALRETLGLFLGQPANTISLISQPGQALSLGNPLAQLHISISHMQGMSVAAISREAVIGIDVMQSDALSGEMNDWAHVAMDYLGPTVTAFLHSTSSRQRPAAFAQAWTCFEACLKCLGIGLTEWTPVLAKQLAACSVAPLALHNNHYGAVACPMQKNAGKSVVF